MKMSRLSFSPVSRYLTKFPEWKTAWKLRGQASATPMTNPIADEAFCATQNDEIATTCFVIKCGAVSRS